MCVQAVTEAAAAPASAPGLARGPSTKTSAAADSGDQVSRHLLFTFFVLVGKPTYVLKNKLFSFTACALDWPWLLVFSQLLSYQLLV